MNIVIPMAGEGSRFKEAGYDTPKPFIDVAGKTMIERVLDNLWLSNAKYILICRKEHLLSEYKSVKKITEKYACKLLAVDSLTMGAACTILLSSWLINNDEPLLLANSDQIVELSLSEFIEDSQERKLDGAILTFYATDTKWSYAKTDRNGMVVKVEEKKVISENATVGLYYFSKGSYFVNAAAQMISMNDRVNGEFYTAPAYNYCVKHGLRVGIFQIDSSQMFGTGTPKDLDAYISHLEKE